MEAIRITQIVKDGQIHLQLPQQLCGQQVEIIILYALPQQNIQNNFNKKSLRGCLKNYANPDLIIHEQDIWQSVAGEKHEHR